MEQNVEVELQLILHNMVRKNYFKGGTYICIDLVTVLFWHLKIVLWESVTLVYALPFPQHASDTSAWNCFI
jgi:hypothetical protein